MHFTINYFYPLDAEGMSFWPRTQDNFSANYYTCGYSQRHTPIQFYGNIISQLGIIKIS